MYLKEEISSNIHITNGSITFMFPFRVFPTFSSMSTLEVLKREILASYENVLPDSEDGPPPLKSVAGELALGRGDPSERRRTESQLAELKGKNTELEKAISAMKKELENVTSVADIRITDMDKTIMGLREENARLRAAMNPEDTSHADELLRMVSREKAAVIRQKEALEAERLELETERRALARLANIQAKSAMASAQSEMRMSSVIAERVKEYSKRLDGCSKTELQDIKTGLQEMLAQKLMELENKPIS